MSRKRVVHWEYGDHAFCGTPGDGSQLLLTESLEPNELVTCKRCWHKWGIQDATPGKFSSAS